MRGLAIAAAAVAAIAIAACGDEEGAMDLPRLDTYLGRIGGTEGYLAVVTDGQDLAGYVTDGRQLGIWLATSELAGGRATLARRTGQPLGKVSVRGDSARGRIRLGPRLVPFEIGRARGNAGLYAASQHEGDDAVEIGWIVLADGTQRGAAFSVVNGIADTRPAPRLRLTDPSVTLGQFSNMVPTELTSRNLDRNSRYPG